jgi:hypothetical protein
MGELVWLLTPPIIISVLNRENDDTLTVPLSAS